MKSYWKGFIPIWGLKYFTEDSDYLMCGNPPEIALMCMGIIQVLSILGFFGLMNVIFPI